MAGTNNFLPVAIGGGANVITQAAYAALASFLDNGYSSGVVDSDQFNKVLRQATFIAAAIGQLVANQNLDALDDGDMTTFVSKLTTAVSGGYLCAVDEKSYGTAGGTNTVGTQTRTLNTLRGNTITGASLGSNQITLPAGTYRVRAIVPAVNVETHRAYLYNVTDSSIILLGNSCNARASVDSDLTSSSSHIFGRFTLAAQKVIEVRHYTNSAVTTYGLGAPVANSGNEVYTMIEIIRE